LTSGGIVALLIDLQKNTSYLLLLFLTIVLVLKLIQLGAPIGIDPAIAAEVHYAACSCIFPAVE